MGLKILLPVATIALMALGPRAMDCVVEPSEESQTVGLVKRLTEIQAMTTGQLRTQFEKLSSRPTGSWNREWLVRKVSWLVQFALRQRSDTVELPTLAQEVRDQPRSPRLNAPIQVLPTGVLDPRLPKPGSVIVRDYRGLRLTVTVLDRGFDWNGQTYSSLTAAAKAITGQHWNGRLFFGLSRRSRGSK